MALKGCNEWLCAMENTLRPLHPLSLPAYTCEEASNNHVEASIYFANRHGSQLPRKAVGAKRCFLEALSFWVYV